MWWFTFYKRNKKLALRALLSYISTREFLRTLEKSTSLVFLKIPACLYNSTMQSGAFFISITVYEAAVPTKREKRRNRQETIYLR